MNPLKRAIIGTLVIASVALTGPTSAYAAPTAQMCTPGVITQHDLAGTYLSAQRTMMAVVYPCGGIYMEWTNAYGQHGATYVTSRHLPDGVIGTVHANSPERLDTSNVLGIKAAEPGWVQVFTVNEFDNLERTYRLRKVS
jgi:hypothetical protein